MWLILVLSCRGPAVERFLDDRVTAICARHERCDTLGSAGFESEVECISELRDASTSLGNAGQLGCDTFDSEAAADCLSELDSAECDEVPDLSGCEEVCE